MNYHSKPRSYEKFTFQNSIESPSNFVTSPAKFNLSYDFKRKIAALRSAMHNNNIDAFIVYSADPHMSEYLPQEWQERSWLSGFTGSAGFVVITKDKAGLWTDGRYFTLPLSWKVRVSIYSKMVSKEHQIISTGLFLKSCRW